MATSAELLTDGFGRIRENVADVLDGLSAEQLAYRIDSAANPVSWLVWHLTRVQDDHVAAAFGTTQVWSSGGWARRFGLPQDYLEHGYGQSSAEVGSVAAATASADLLLEYHVATYAQTVKLVSEVSDSDLDRVVDKRWTPPVTLGVRLVSVLDDDMQHVGQAAYVRGVVLRRSLLLALVGSGRLGVTARGSVRPDETREHGTSGAGAGYAWTMALWMAVAGSWQRAIEREPGESGGPREPAPSPCTVGPPIAGPTVHGHVNGRSGGAAGRMICTFCQSWR